MEPVIWCRRVYTWAPRFRLMRGGTQVFIYSPMTAAELANRANVTPEDGGVSRL